MKTYWMTAVLAAVVALTPALPTLAATENTTAESSAVLAETSGGTMKTSEDTARTTNAATNPSDVTKMPTIATKPSTDSTITPEASAKTTEEATLSGEQLPNPMIPYTSYSEMAAALGFRPLALPRAEGYELTNAFVIGGTVGDLRYTSRYGDPAKRSQLTLRTALLANLEDSGNDAWTTLSGIYSVEWQPLRLGADTILIAQIDSTSFVAAWAEGDFIFTCEGENFNRWDFTHRIVYDLIDITEHYYTAE